MERDIDQPKPTKRTIRQRCKSLTFVLFSAVCVALSLLSFPSLTPWVAVFWLLWHWLCFWLNRPAWVPLIACFAILFVKLLPLTPAILCFGVVVLFAAIYRYRTHASKQRVRFHWCVPIAVFLAWGWMCYEWRSIEACDRNLQLDDRPIVCLGDSLTEGLLPDKGFPEQLKGMVGVPVINLGFSGISTSQGLGQIDRVLSHGPQVVIIELGGHDFLKWRSRRQTKQNLVQLVQRCREKDAEVVLMEIPRGFIFDPYASLERQVAYEHDVQLVSDTWLREIVLMSPIAPPGRWLDAKHHFSDDGIHSNERGSKAIAQRVKLALREMYGPEIER